MSEMVERVARALQASAGEFANNVAAYVCGEAQQRFMAANPSANPYWRTEAEWELESWKILARAAIAAMREPTEVMLKRGADAQETPNKPIESIAAALSAYTAMIDEALK